ncbi:hypothetical protein T4A_6994 [Trichinella pseudospiralis]|uniref:Uncharacterized protein n=1 Tax=Trichinella pseudospiralis TaxID=6337 RepID=A0A0V1E255_TRIPS|nr:hypothetical protein T4A_6994 [Trichinella pseudospiralis]
MEWLFKKNWLVCRRNSTKRTINSLKIVTTLIELENIVVILIIAHCCCDAETRKCHPTNARNNHQLATVWSKDDQRAKIAGAINTKPVWAFVNCYQRLTALLKAENLTSFFHFTD